MIYCGENKYFSFRKGFCESLPGITLTSSEISEFGRIISRFFRRFSVGCDNFGHNYVLYAICCGISECGKDAYICENTDLPSFLFGLPLISADCGIYVSGNGKSIKISLFDGKRFPMNSKIMREIMSSYIPEPSKHCGKLISIGSFRDIYINNLTESLKNGSIPIQAGISCGNRSVRSLWNEFFTGTSDNFVFRISDDGRKVNAYSSELGFISNEKLLLASAFTIASSDETVFLPQDFHYGADNISSDRKINFIRFNPDEEIPDTAANQRFLWDPLYMCTQLAQDKHTFLAKLKELPPIASVNREIILVNTDDIPQKRAISDKDGRILITPSGRSRITLTVQAFRAETASELCGFWADKIKKGDF